jgi:hypothetical protein
MAIAFASIAAKGEGTASAAPAYPASLANNDLVLCHVVNKPYNSPVVQLHDAAGLDRLRCGHLG